MKKKRVQPTPSPTTEQRLCCEAAVKRENVIINACAGSGKSTALRMIIESLKASNPSLRILTVMFNKAAVVHFEKNLSSEGLCDTKTTHALAHAASSKQLLRKLHIKRKLRREDIANLLEIKPIKIPQSFSLGKEISVETLTEIVVAAIRRFLISADFTINDWHVSSLLLLPKFTLDDERQQNFKRSVQDKLISYTTSLWKLVTDWSTDIPIQHDTYLKLWQLSKPELGKYYDVLLVDEAQDTNPCFEDVIKRFNGQVILVGDKYQAIYGWRGATNAMENAEKYIRNPVLLNLSQSFRYGEQVADVANDVLKISPSFNFKIKGCDSIESSVTNDLIGDERYTILCRSNAGVIQSAMFVLSSGKKPFIVGDISDFIRLLRSAYSLYNEQLTLNTHPQLAQFASWEEFVDTSELNEDVEMLRLIQMIDVYKEKCLIIADTLSQLHGIKEKDADVTICTAHKAKGLEWSAVKIYSDFSFIDDLLKRKLDNTGKFYINYNEYIRYQNIQQEINLLYVAVTRAQKTLVISDSIIAAVKELAWSGEEKEFELSTPTKFITFVEDNEEFDFEGSFELAATCKQNTNTNEWVVFFNRLTARISASFYDEENNRLKDCSKQQFVKMCKNILTSNIINKEMV